MQCVVVKYDKAQHYLEKNVIGLGSRLLSVL